jgi:REP element-mobilizing transposase RayT
MNNRYNPNIHHRRSIRLKGYDYSQAGLYFVTLCVQNRINLFGIIENGEMQLNSFGLIAKEEWEKTPEIRKNITLEEFIVMPNHFHAIISIDYQIKNSTGVSQYAPNTNKSQYAQNMDKSQYAPEFKSPSNTIGAIIRGYKGATTKRIKEIIRGELQFAPNKFAPKFAPANITQIDLSKSIWQRNYWEHIIRNEIEHKRISHYIINNPIKWEKDKLNGGSGNILKEPSADYNSEIWMI